MPRKLIPPLALLAGLFIATALAFGTSGSPTSANPQIESEETAFLTLINTYRSQNGLGVLQATATLNNASDWMSNDMGVNAYFSHNDSQWRSPWTRMCDFGYCYSTSKGENIAAGYTSAQSVFNAWKASPGHNSNMLGASFKVIGIGRVYVAGSPYGYYWTTDFGGVVVSGAPATTTAPTLSPSPTPGPSATPVATPATTATPAPTPAVLPATPTAKPSATPKVVHDVSVTTFTVASEAHAGDTKPIVIGLTNRGTQAESVSYGVTATCLDGQPNKVLECGSLQYSPECSGNVTLAPGQKVEIRCSITYNTSTGRDRWRHTVKATIEQDSKPADNSRFIERRVI